MTSEELYELLDKAGVDYEVVDIFGGLRILRVVVLEDEEDES